MIVAIITVRLATIPAGLSFLDWLDDFLYLPETLYILILTWLICSGPEESALTPGFSAR
jgi:putative oxidoreductase